MRTDATAAHVDALRRTLEYVLTHPDEYDQETFGYSRDPRDPTERATSPACGTTFCVGGHAAVTVAGATPVWTDGYEVAPGVFQPVGLLDDVVPPGRAVDDEDAWVPVHEYAIDALGLTSREGALLFAGNNSLVEVANYAYEFTGGRVDLRVPAAHVQRRRLAGAS